MIRLDPKVHSRLEAILPYVVVFGSTLILIVVLGWHLLGYWTATLDKIP